jgi:hypothetical protein
VQWFQQQSKGFFLEGEHWLVGEWAACLMADEASYTTALLFRPDQFLDGFYLNNHCSSECNKMSFFFKVC